MNAHWCTVDSEVQTIKVALAKTSEEIINASLINITYILYL